jgi:ribosomal protein S17E
MAWLCCSSIKGETSSLITAAQDQAFSKRYHQRNIMHQPAERKYRICYKAEEHTKHNVAGCTTLVPSAHTNIHNNVAGYIQRTICKYMGLQVTGRYCEHLHERLKRCRWCLYYVGRTGCHRSKNISKLN